MNRLLLFLVNVLIFVVLFSMFSCERPTPTIIFSTPIAEYVDPETGKTIYPEYFKDDNIPVKVIVTDNKGNAATVRLYAKDVLLYELNTTPYHFEIPAGILPPGTQIIKVTAENKSGKQGEAFRQIIVKNENFQSNDYVTFQDGKIPRQWRAVGWEISIGGMGDLYYVSSETKINSISTSKKCNKIEFYLKGWGKARLYLNGQLWKTISLGDGWYDQSWEKFEYSLPTAIHTFTWQRDSMPSTVIGLDAIRFSIEE